MSPATTNPNLADQGWMTDQQRDELNDAEILGEEIYRKVPGVDLCQAKPTADGVQFDFLVSGMVAASREALSERLREVADLIEKGVKAQ